METKELRIGNLISSKCHGGLITEIFSIIDSKNVKLGANPMALYKKDEIEPINLTEEILINFGFNKTGINFELNKFELWTNINDGNYYFRYVYANKPSILIQYVHQLQNLYFVLTNKELKNKSTLKH
jgi:hypothetical protein